MKLQVTHHGVARADGEKSEDAMRVLQRDDRVIAALADGLGSSRQGGEAAQRAVAMMVDYLHARPQAWSPRRALAEFVQQINQVLHQESLLQRGEPELLCTLSVVVIEGGVLYGLNVGDSPVLVWRQGKLRQLSQHHVMDQAGMEHVLTQAVGLARELAPAHFELSLEDGDVVLLCSDGVGNALSRERLCELLGRRIAARALVHTVTETWQEHPELRDDASAIVLDLLELGHQPGHSLRELEVLQNLLPGDRHDSFTLVRPLHEGGRVWLATDAAGQSQVLKFPPADAADDEQRREAFLRELWHASRMDSPDFVRAHVPLEGSLRYYVLEYIQAPTLRETLKHGHLRVEEGIELARFLLRAAQYLLSRDHVHGDIKPENILVLRAPEGVSFRMLDLGSTAGVLSVHSRAGTPSYLAPERFEGAAVSERTEIFSIGVTLHEALTGALPFGEIERFQTPRFDRLPRRPSQRNRAIPGWLDCVIQRALSVDTATRHQSFSEMAYELDNPDKVVPFHAHGEPLRHRNQVLFYKILSAVLLACVLVLTWLLVRR